MEISLCKRSIECVSLYYYPDNEIQSDLYLRDIIVYENKKDKTSYIATSQGEIKLITEGVYLFKEAVVERNTKNKLLDIEISNSYKNLKISFGIIKTGNIDEFSKVLENGFKKIDIRFLILQYNCYYYYKKFYDTLYNHKFKMCVNYLPIY